MIAHDRESCPDCHGRPRKPDLAGFEGWDNPERFKQEIRSLIHELERWKDENAKLKSELLKD